ncbi:hypothetical protein PPGU16_84280 (plasmid) [Paraburkholderia largidicola]|uniref:DUF3717 domain-containing protein n=1 Tax=Paraburkholderia largidicola TaxID=3014751 RepID=A0A7I8C4G5_9BURK|nr:hypothetical protein PPGU16_84280 [Paraburkholderia sp. PGU16]
MDSYTVDQLERAINIWRAKQVSDKDAALCRPASLLAEPYALAIIERRSTVDASTLSADQVDALKQALEPDSIKRN